MSLPDRDDLRLGTVPTWLRGPVGTRLIPTEPVREAAQTVSGVRGHEGLRSGRGARSTGSPDLGDLGPALERLEVVEPPVTGPPLFRPVGLILLLGSIGPLRGGGLGRGVGQPQG